MDTAPVRTSVALQRCVASACCFLLCSMDDTSVYVAQRATLYLATIHDNAIDVSSLALDRSFVDDWDINNV